MDWPYIELAGTAGDRSGLQIDSDTLMAARSQPNHNWGSIFNGGKYRAKHVGGGSGM